MSDISINRLNVNHPISLQPVNDVGETEKSSKVNNQHLLDLSDENTESVNDSHSFKRGLRNLKNSPNKV